MKEELEKQVGLPENAFRPLKPGEKYEPLMSPDKEYPEVNFRSVSWGIIMAIIFSAAAAFLGLKVGQVFEAAIPIAIIAVGVSSATKRKGALGENVIIQSIGACSGVIVAGAIFTLPALYILQEKYPEMTVNFMQMFISSLLGGVLGILFLIPFRKYFVKEKHGEYPFPEATASTQVLVSGEKGGDQAKPLLLAGLVGGLYDFIVGTLGWWNENFTSRVCGWGEALADKFKLVFKINTGAAVLGLGYIVGLKYAAIICAGSIAVWLIIVPGLSLIWGDQVLNAWNPDITLAVKDMTPEQIFSEYAKSIGIGGIAMAGIIGIVRSWDIIKSAVKIRVCRIPDQIRCTAVQEGVEHIVFFLTYLIHHPRFDDTVMIYKVVKRYRDTLLWFSWLAQHEIIVDKGIDSLHRTEAATRIHFVQKLGLGSPVLPFPSHASIIHIDIYRFGLDFLHTQHHVQLIKHLQLQLARKIDLTAPKVLLVG